jgi:hypothetical protein
MRRLRMAVWSLAIGVLSVVLAALFYRLLPAGGAAFVGLLFVCTEALALVTGLLVELPPAAGAAAGAFGALLVAAVLGLTIAVAPLAPGAQRPHLSELFGKPLVALVVFVAVTALAGWSGVRVGARLARRPR